ncbi:ketopantoate reductase family protein [Microbacterium sp. zg.B48]|uniref:ketopantoate reductase family protein n=1 Tax=Microbacterium sp. zg.B48 TaxID=2969408 RepID=UPI00214B8699|nr:2-dehydropantoate 2-reductase N-terminal domain-containing protein [Microbacterium sp. zg.B48]MCR2764368.1 ketopantoate reductase family protein [Microbacterium sp. zg.B48]
MHYVVYGAGAVGGVVGARLADAGIRVTLVARGGHLEAIRADGLTLESVSGRTRHRLDAFPSAEHVRWASECTVLLAVKSDQTAAALDDLAAFAPPETTVVAMQNGVANERQISRRFDGTYSCFVMMPCAHLEPGVVVEQCHPIPGIIDVGRYPSGRDPFVDSLASDLVSAGFAAESRSEIMAWKYRKLLTNLGNVVQACFRPGHAADELAGLAREEGEATLREAGIAAVSEDEDLRRREGILRGWARPDAFGSSWQSLARGTGSLEADYLNGEIALMGRLHDVPTPVNRSLQLVARRVVIDRVHPRTMDAASLLDSYRASPVSRTAAGS